MIRMLLLLALAALAAAAQAAEIRIAAVPDSEYVIADLTNEQATETAPLIRYYTDEKGRMWVVVPVLDAATDP